MLDDELNLLYQITEENTFYVNKKRVSHASGIFRSRSTTLIKPDPKMQRMKENGRTNVYSIVHLLHVTLEFHRSRLEKSSFSLSFHFQPASNVLHFPQII